MYKEHLSVMKPSTNYVRLRKSQNYSAHVQVRYVADALKTAIR